MIDLPCTIAKGVKWLLIVEPLDKDNDVPGTPNEIPNFQLSLYFLLQDLLKLLHQLLLHPLPIQSPLHSQHSSLNSLQHSELLRIRLK